jgi:hypothetical protein
VHLPALTTACFIIRRSVLCGAVGETHVSRSFRVVAWWGPAGCKIALKHLQTPVNNMTLGTVAAKGLVELTHGRFTKKMKTFAPLIVAALALSSIAGCSTESATEMTAEEASAVCANPEGTNAAIAALTAAISQELHRWQVTTDFYEYRGSNNQLMLGLTSAGLAACGGSCPKTSEILKYQDSSMDQKIVFGTVRLSSWSFASRLTTGWENQGVNQRAGRAPFAAHVFGVPTTAPGACDTLFTFPVAKPAGGGNLSVAEINQLSNALIWTTGNGPNPYIAFQPGVNTVTVDPGGNLNPPGQTTGSDTCQKVSMTSLNGQPCTCADRNIYSNGQLKNDDPNATKTYFCRQM